MRERVTLTSVDPLSMANLYALFGLASGAIFGLVHGGLFALFFAFGRELPPAADFILKTVLSMIFCGVAYGLFCWVGTIVSIAFLNLGLRLVGGVKLVVDRP